MKYFFVVFIAFVAVAGPIATFADPSPSYGQAQSYGRAQSYGQAPAAAAATPLKLGDLLKSPITSLVQQIVQLLATEILKLIPGTTAVPIQALLAVVADLPNPTVANVLAAVLKLLGAPAAVGAALLGILPKIVANTLINVPNLANVLTSQIPQTVATAPLATVLPLIGAYLVDLLVLTLVGLLNLLSTQ